MPSLSTIGEYVAHCVVVLVTLPYYRFYEFNTLGVIQRIAHHCSNPDEFPLLLRVLSRWRHRKLAELQYISIAVSLPANVKLNTFAECVADHKRAYAKCAILLGAVIGSLSWNNAAAAFWLARAFWYISIILSVLGILLSAQQIAVLNFLGDLPRDPHAESSIETANRYLPLLVTGTWPTNNPTETPNKVHIPRKSSPKYKMVFVWQCPIMFMSYSVCLFLMGLTILVITPLINLGFHGGWSGDATVAVIYLASATVSGLIFVFCAFWVYHYLDITVDSILDHGIEEDAEFKRQQIARSPTGTMLSSDDRVWTSSIQATPLSHNKIDQRTIPIQKPDTVVHDSEKLDNQA